jgi:hypothetical protein
MRIEYSARAIADIKKIVAWYREVAGVPVADAFDRRLHAAVERIRKSPMALPILAHRAAVRIALLSHFPTKYSSGWATAW